jgi:hypothetical protein
MYRAMQNPDTPNLPFAQRPKRNSVFKPASPNITVPSEETEFTPPPQNYSKHGCDCPNCKNGIGECSDKCAKCNAWDIGCELGCTTDVIVDWGEKTHEDIVDWGEKTHDDITTAIDETKKTITDTVDDIIETVEDIPNPLEPLKYLPLILIGGVALLVMK